MGGLHNHGSSINTKYVMNRESIFILKEIWHTNLYLLKIQHNSTGQNIVIVPEYWVARYAHAEARGDQQFE
jgi:hypothetical protein